jgi:DNA-directed RNA polymerase beta subunit
MERDCVISHGGAMLLKERLFIKSDFYQVHICQLCGSFSTTPTECRACDTDQTLNIHFPFASKLLTQELQAMSIKVKLGVIKV